MVTRKTCACNRQALPSSLIKLPQSRSSEYASKQASSCAIIERLPAPLHNKPGSPAMAPYTRLSLLECRCWNKPSRILLHLNSSNLLSIAYHRHAFAAPVNMSAAFPSVGVGVGAWV